jgi:DNA (cytosine-5)-methyltransferase 1
MDEDIESTVQVEVNRHRQTVLNRHWPNILKREDITDVTGKEIGRIDGLHGGFPCTGTSFGAPNRQGLAHRESAHFFDFIRLLDEYQRLIDETNPRWVVIENPVGLLSSPRPPKKGTPAWNEWDGVDRTGWDMAAVVRALEDLGYGWAYRVVDGRYLGPAGRDQKRERVIVVGHRGGDPRPAWEVLADDGPGEGQAAPRTKRRGPGGPSARRGPAEDGSLIWRKSARPRASLAKGGYETWVPADFANTLTKMDGGSPSRQQHIIYQDGRLRAFTPMEWERLQGFPDGWTEGIPDGARYDALGDAMHVGMAEWLGRRLAAVHHALPQIESTHLRGGAA